MNTEEICRKCKNGELAYPDIKACEDNNRKSLERAQLYEKCGMYLDAFDFYEMACNDTDPYDYIKSVELLTHAAQLAHEHGYHSQEAHLYGHVAREYLYDANKIDRKQKKMRIMPAMDAIDKSVKASLEVPDIETAAKTCWMTADDYIVWRMAFERIIVLYEKASDLAKELLASAKESFRKEYFLDMLIGVHYFAGAAYKYLQDYKSTQNHWKISDEYTERLVVEFNREREKIKHGLEWLMIDEGSTDMDISGLKSIDTDVQR